MTLILSDSRREGSDPAAYSALVSKQGTTIEKTPTPGSAEAEVHATTADLKACLIGGVALNDLPNIRIVGNDAAVEALVRATRFEADQRAS